MTPIDTGEESPAADTERRPVHLVAVAGTATDIGKTWITAAVASQLRINGRTVAIRKPVQSFDPTDPHTDADVLGDASGEPPETVCPTHRWLPVPMAPPMATAALGLPPISLDNLIGELRWPIPRADIGFVEMVGGVRSPVADDGDSRDFIRRIEPDVIIVVADAALGAIDRIRLATDAVASIARPLVVLNRFDANDGLHARNFEWLTNRDGLDVTTSASTLAERIERTLSDEAQIGHR